MPGAGTRAYRGRWRETVQRSALALKLLTSPTRRDRGRAATFGLPEWVGGDRNWDYRYTWIRDAAFTVYALMRLGFTDEADAFMRLGRAAVRASSAPDGSLQIMYAPRRRHELAEDELDHLAGYAARGRCGSATPPPSNCSSTSTAS